MRVCMSFLHPLRPVTCPAGPSVRGASSWQTLVAQDRSVDGVEGVCYTFSDDVTME